MRAGLVALALCAACGGASRGAGSAGTPATAGEVHAPAPDALVGDYECRFARGPGELAPSTCAIRAGGDGRLRLEQPGGALRLTGSVEPADAGFLLTGEVVCTGEPCPLPTRQIIFFTQRTGAFSAVIPLSSGDLLNIDLTRR